MPTATLMSIPMITIMPMSSAAAVSAAEPGRSTEVSRKLCFPICLIIISIMRQSWRMWQRSSGRPERKMWQYR